MIGTPSGYWYSYWYTFNPNRAALPKRQRNKERLPSHSMVVDYEIFKYEEKVLSGTDTLDVLNSRLDAFERSARIPVSFERH